MNSELRNQTSSDAFLRVLESRMGMLAHNPSMEYLLALRKQLYSMIKNIDGEIANHPDTTREIRGKE